MKKSERKKIEGKMNQIDLVLENNIITENILYNIKVYLMIWIKLYFRFQI